MTSREMAYRFLIIYDKITSYDAPGYEDPEVSRLLSIAQENIIKRFYNPLGNKYKKGFENSEKRRTDLDELIRAYSISTPSTNQTGVHDNGVYYDLPSDFLWAIEERVETNIDLDTCDTIDPINITSPLIIGNQTEQLNDPTRGSTYNWKVIPVIPRTHDQYNIDADNPFRRPDDGQAWRMNFHRETVYTNPKRHELITDGTYSILRYILRYIKRPVDIVVDNVNVANNVDCELDESMHMEIVYEAVTLATGITNPESYQIKAVEGTKAE